MEFGDVITLDQAVEDLEKSHVRAHVRRGRNGMINVKEHERAGGRFAAVMRHHQSIAMGKGKPLKHKEMVHHAAHAVLSRYKNAKEAQRHVDRSEKSGKGFSYRTKSGHLVTHHDVKHALAVSKQHGINPFEKPGSSKKVVSKKPIKKEGEKFKVTPKAKKVNKVEEKEKPKMKPRKFTLDLNPKKAPSAAPMLRKGLQTIDEIYTELKK